MCRSLHSTYNYINFVFDGLCKNVSFFVLHRNTPASHSELQNAISIVLENPLFATPMIEAQECHQAARSLVMFFDKPSEVVKQFCQWIVSSLKCIVDKSKQSSAGINKEKLWMEYHKLTSSVQFNDKWKPFLMQI